MNPFLEITNDAYHADHSRVGHSMLEIFRRSPVEYAARFVHHTMLHPEPTPAKCLGAALHALVMEPDRYDELTAVAPDVDRRTKEGKASWSQFLAEAGQRTVITEEQNEIVTKMAKSVLAHPEAAKLFKRAEHREKAVYWTNEATESELLGDLSGRVSPIERKCKFDLLYAAGAVIGDLKTANDPTPSAWSRQAATLSASASWPGPHCPS